MATRFKVFLGSLMLAAYSVCTAGTTYDANSQFDINNNPAALGGWSYGSASSLGGPFTLLQTKYSSSPTFGGWSFSSTTDYPDVIKNTSGANYTDPNGGFIPAGALTFAPGQGLTASRYAIVRWSAPASGTFSINSVFTGVWDHPNSLGDVHVLVNGASVFDGTIDRHSSTSFSGTRALVAGDVVDFSAGQSFPNEWARSILSASISAVPEPATIVLLVAGICGVYVAKGGQTKRI